MKTISNRLLGTLAAMLVLILGGTTIPAQTVNIVELQRSFERPPDDARIMMRWWWFGPAVSKPELEREMRLMKEGGIGGFEINPVYPLMPDDPSKGFKNFAFLSDEYIDALRFVSAKARELGLRMDLTLGSGWPFGGPTVPITDASGMLRSERVKIDDKSRRLPLPSMTAGEKLLAVFVARTQEGQSILPDSLREVTEIKDGLVSLPTDLRGANEALFFISSRTGMQVKRPAFGAEGYVLDHMSRTATENYLKAVGDRLMQAFGPGARPFSVFGDSLEVYNQDWTDDFLEEFRRRRGYDLKPYLPALVADMGPKTAGIRYDWGRTQTELLNERFLTPVREWARRNRTQLRFQVYGIPAATISSNAFVDLSDGEGAQWKVVRATRWASSANHMYGRPVTASETWTWLHSPVFRATPLDMKAEADLHFLMGINQLIGHGWPYTAPGVEYPGWRFYAAAVLDEKNPWWIVMPDIALYLQRMSYLMRQGQPANDVALYLPDSDAWSSFTAGKVHMIDTLREMVGTDVISTVMATGYGFDFFDDEALKQVGRVEQGALALGPNKYRVVVLPNVEHIPLDTLRRLEEFVRGGGLLVATRRRPQIAPGLQATEAEQKEVREISRRLFEGPSAPAHFVKDETRELASVLAGLLRPDLALAPNVPDIGFIHRRSRDAEIYFLANTSNIRQSVKATFRVEGMNAELWDAMTGGVSRAEVLTQAGGGTTLALDLAPYESRVVIFSKRALTRPAAPAAQAAGDGAPAVDLSTGWRVSFGQTGTPVMMEKLRSWTESEETRYFSGTATYEREVNVPESLLRSGQSVRLDFGEGKPIPAQALKAGMQTWLEAPVREAAVVYVNDRRAGSVWSPPYSLDVTGLLRVGANKIRIEVANLALNYMAGRRLPDYRLLNLRYGERFQAQDMDKVQPITAGLLGPVRLSAESK